MRARAHTHTHTHTHIAKEDIFGLVLANEIFVSEAVSELCCSVFHYNTTF